MKTPVLFITGVVLATLSGIAGYKLYQHQAAAGDEPVAVKQEPETLLGSMRPSFSLTDINGELRDIKEWQGKVIALNFWATWCPPCLKEIPEFIHLQEKYAERGLQFVGVALENVEPVKKFVTEKGVNYPVMAGELEVIKIAKSYGNQHGALPYTVIIDREGRIAFVKAGALPVETAEQVISGLL